MLLSPHSRMREAIATMAWKRIQSLIEHLALLQRGNVLLQRHSCEDGHHHFFTRATRDAIITRSARMQRLHSQAPQNRVGADVISSV
jgi:hypothetical protein